VRPAAEPSAPALAADRTAAPAGASGASAANGTTTTTGRATTSGATAALAPSPAGVSVSTPGKLILAGEHAAVYGRPALVAAIDLRLRARFSAPGPGDAGIASAAGSGAAGPSQTAGSSQAANVTSTRSDLILLDLPGLGARCETSWPEVRRYAEQAAASWRDYVRRLDAASFRGLCGSDPLHLVKVALGEAAAALPEPPGPLALAVDSELPIGSGFGSSAAAALALVAGLLAWCGRPFDPLEVERLALEVERRQHGLPSGIDTATTLGGGLLWAFRLPGGELATEPLAARSPLLGRLRVYDTGTPPEPTGAVVAAVRERQGRAPERHERLFDRMAAAVRALRGELGKPREDPAEVVELLREHESCLEELGVVPAPVRELARRVEREGGAAKISGAGSLAGPGGGSFLVYHAEAERIAGWSFLAPLRHHAVHLGAPGLRIEND
jgi:mevalonate kinase